MKKLFTIALCLTALPAFACLVRACCDREDRFRRRMNPGAIRIDSIERSRRREAFELAAVEHTRLDPVGEIVLDPASGTGGFLVEAFNHLSKQVKTVADRKILQEKSLSGCEPKPLPYLLCQMNLLLHGLDAPRILKGNSLEKKLTDIGDADRADVILTNPPFGARRGGGGPSREDLEYPTANKQLAFLQHIYRGLKPGGRAGVVLPDNVLFEDNVGRLVRADLMERCDLHTLVRLPTGIFYAQGVKTNALFFTRGRTDRGNTRAVWVYDLRSNMPSFGRRTPFTREFFSEFEAAYGDDPHGRSERTDHGEAGRWRRFSREEVARRGDNLDITWLADEAVADRDEAGEPGALAAQILALLRTATAEIEALQAELADPGESGRGAA